MKIEIMKVEGIHPDLQRILFHGKQIDSCGGTMNDHNIQKESSLYLLPRLRGGMMYISSMARFRPEQAVEERKTGENNAIRCPSCNDMLQVKNNAGSSMA